MPITPDTKLKDLADIAVKDNICLLMLTPNKEKFTRVVDYVNVHPDWTIRNLAEQEGYTDYVLDHNQEIIFDSRTSQANTSSATSPQTSQ